jgi:hypothetical protein
MLPAGMAVAPGALCDHDLPQGLSTPSLALQFAASRRDVEKVLGQTIVCGPGDPAPRGACRRNRAALDAQQVRDFWFIPLYAGFLGLVGLMAARDARWWVRVPGIAAVVLVLLAALCDVRENLVVRALLRPVSDCAAMPWFWARAKWSLLCAVVLLHALFLLASRRVVAGTARWAGYVAVGLAVVAAYFGGSALLRQDDSNFENAASAIFGAVAATWVAIAGQAWFPRGLLAGLDDLTRWRWLRRLSEWPSD